MAWGTLPLSEKVPYQKKVTGADSATTVVQRPVPSEAGVALVVSCARGCHLGDSLWRPLRGHTKNPDSKRSHIALGSRGSRPSRVPRDPRKTVWSVRGACACRLEPASVVRLCLRHVCPPPNVQPQKRAQLVSAPHHGLSTAICPESLRTVSTSIARAVGRLPRDLEYPRLCIEGKVTFLSLENILVTCVTWFWHIVQSPLGPTTGQVMLVALL